MIIGITGTDGAGKGTVVEYLKTKGFQHYSSREFIVSAIEDEGLEVSRDQMRRTANHLRAQHGNDFVVKQAFEKAEAEGASHVVIESVRALAEAQFLQKHGGILLAVDAPPELRYERVQARRSETDKVSYEQFLKHEELEKNDPDPHGMQKTKVMEMADYTLMNDGTLADLHAQVDAFLEQVQSSTATH